MLKIRSQNRLISRGRLLLSGFGALCFCGGIYYIINAPVAGTSGKKQIIGDAVIGPGGSLKNFGQCFIPIITYYKAVSENYEELVRAGYVKVRSEYDRLFM